MNEVQALYFTLFGQNQLHIDWSTVIIQLFNELIVMENNGVK